MNGVLFGGLIAGAGLYLFGTKNGRKNTKKLLDVFENLEDIVADYDSKSKKQSAAKSAVVTDVENLINKLQAVLPTKKSK